MFTISLRSSILPLRSLSIFINMVLNFASGILVASISFNFFSKDFSVFSFGIYFFVSPFCLGVLGRYLWWLCDEGVLLGSVAQSFTSPELCFPEMFSVGYVHPPIVVESWKLLTLLWLELTLQAGWLISVNLNQCVWDTMWGLSFKVEFFPAGSGTCWNSSLDVQLVWIVGLSSGVVWSSPVVVLVLGPLGNGSGKVNVKYWVISFGLPVRIYYSVYFLWLHQLGLGVWGRGHTVYKHWLSPAGSWEWICKRTEAPWGLLPLVSYSPPYEVALFPSRAFQRKAVE